MGVRVVSAVQRTGADLDTIILAVVVVPGLPGVLFLREPGRALTADVHAAAAVEIGQVETHLRHAVSAQFDRAREEGDQIFVLLDGKAMVEKDTGKTRVKIQPLRSGDVFGEMSLMGEKTRAADIVSSGDSHVLEIRYEKIFELFQKEPRIFGLLLFNISRLISRRLSASNSIIVKLQKELGRTKAA